MLSLSVLTISVAEASGASIHGSFACGLKPIQCRIDEQPEASVRDQMLMPINTLTITSRLQPARVFDFIRRCRLGITSLLASLREQSRTPFGQALCRSRSENGFLHLLNFSVF